METSIQASELEPEKGKWPGRLMALLVFGAIGLLSFWLQARAWLAPGFGGVPSDTQALTDTLLQVILLGVPLLVLAWRWPHPRYRAMFQTWLWGCGLLLALGWARIVPPAQSQLALWLQLAGALVWLAIVYGVLWRNRLPAANWSNTTAIWLSWVFGRF